MSPLEVPGKRLGFYPTTFGSDGLVSTPQCLWTISAHWRKAPTFPPLVFEHSALSSIFSVSVNISFYRGHLTPYRSFRCDSAFALFVAKSCCRRFFLGPRHTEHTMAATLHHPDLH